VAADGNDNGNCNCNCNCFIAETQGAQRPVSDRQWQFPKNALGIGSALSDSWPLRPLRLCDKVVLCSRRSALSDS